MEKLLDLQGRYKMTRWLVIISLLSFVAISITSIVLSYKNQREFSKRIYVVNKNEQFEAMVGDVNDNRPVEIDYHVRRFHELFFNVSPDPKQIEENVTKAFFLGDQSIKKLYDDLYEQDYYKEMVQGNVVQKVSIDSVLVNSVTYPYKATAFCHIVQTRATSKSKKRLVTTCVLEDVPRTLNTPNGLFIRNFKVASATNEK